MTLGEKIKNARLNAGLTQEQLAEKLMISRPAVTKWESDRGIPDIDNLKALSQLLDVSIDYLVGNDVELELTTVREPINLQSKGYFKNFDEKDSILKEKYPDGVFYHLSAEKKLTKSEKVIDNIIGYVFDGPFGVPDLINDVHLMDRKFYLMIRSNTQYLVSISKDFIESRRMISDISTVKGTKFVVGDTKFRVHKKVK